MAKLQEQVIVIKVSRLLKDNEEMLPLIGNPDLESLEQVVQQLAGDKSLVEIVGE